MIREKQLFCESRFSWVTFIALFIPLISPRHGSAAGINGQVMVWGAFFFPYENPETKFVKIAAGNDCSMALTYDGRVVQWGANRGLPNEVLSGVREISSGYYHNLALKTNQAAPGAKDNLPKINVSNFFRPWRDLSALHAPTHR